MLLSYISDMSIGYIKIDKPLQEVEDIVRQKFQTKQYNEVISDEYDLPSRYKLKCVFLYATANPKKLTYYKPAKNTFKVRHQEVSSYDRFLIFGVEGTNHVLLSFTQTSLESRRILGYSQQITPGTPVWVLCPKVIGYLKTTQNPLISINDPLIPSARWTLYKAPPNDINVPNYVFFDFQPTNFRIVQAMPKDNVCTGKLCDAQGANPPCSCIVAESKRHWAITFKISCNELNERITGEKNVEITSSSLTKLLVHTNKRTEQLSSDNVDTFEMEDKVTALASNVFNTQGVRIIGWFKPAIDEEGVASGNFAYHISAIIPVAPLNEQQQLMMYGSPDADH